jgi:hypothetical protein
MITELAGSETDFCHAQNFSRQIEQRPSTTSNIQWLRSPLPSNLKRFRNGAGIPWRSNRSIDDAEPKSNSNPLVVFVAATARTLPIFQ